MSIQNNSSEIFPTKLVNRPEKLNISKNLINRAEYHHEADVSYLFLDLEKSTKNGFLKNFFCRLWSQYRISKHVGFVVMFSSIYRIFRCVQFLRTSYQFCRKQFNVFNQHAHSVTVGVGKTFGTCGRRAPIWIDWSESPRILVFIFFPVASTKRCLTEYGLLWPNQPIVS